MSVLEYYQEPVSALLKRLAVDPSRGLSQQEASNRLREHGANLLKDPPRPSLIMGFLRQFQDFMVMVLIGATLISALLGETADALAILAIILCNAVLGFVQEYKAERSLEALQTLAAPTCVVLRDGREKVIEAADLVPGDIVFLASGQRIPADGRLLEANLLEIEEAALTGESHAVEKQEDLIASHTLPLGDRKNSVFMGTTVTRGKGRFVVTATGMDTEIGKIAGMIHSATLETTPLQRRLQELGQWLVLGCLLVVCFVFVAGVLRGFPVYRMFLTGVSLAVAAIPEGLPAVVTVALAIGVQRMSRRNAIVRHLPAVETLGCATVICSDKTGTLTQNLMTVREIRVADETYRVTGAGYSFEGEITAESLRQKAGAEADLRRVLIASTICNNARIYPAETRESGVRGVWRRLRSKGDPKTIQSIQLNLVGDPTEGALLVAAAKMDICREGLSSIHRFVAELPFDSRRKRMTVITRSLDEGVMAWTKGAPDAILGFCTRIRKNGMVVPLSGADRQKIRQHYESMSSSALRVLGIAERPYALDARVRRTLRETEVERDLTFLGLIGMIDPPRPEAVRAIALARRAGIRTIMVTGDHANTAVAIARELGLLGRAGQALTGADIDQMTDEELQEAVRHTDVFARVQPDHKVRIVRALRSIREIVGMTGDGVNDAPAVKEADIGIAMGKTGTDVTKEASDIVLIDDNFATIVAAIEEGRIIYDNIRKFIRYLLGCNVGEVLTMLLAAIVGLPLPLLPIQILWMNLVTDGLPAIALGVDPGDADIMTRQPRPFQEGIFARGLHLRIAAQGGLIGLSTLAVFVLELFLGSGTLDVARTMAFTTLVLSQLLFVFQCRSESHRVWEIGILSNPWLVGAVAISTIMHLAVVYTPVFQSVFKTVPLSFGQWALVTFFTGWCAVFADVVLSVAQRIRRRLAWMRVSF